MLSYAQNLEDVYLHRCFGDLDRGFYIDLGASHPVHSNSAYHFYLRGWSGINVEPAPHRHAELERARPRDLNLAVAVGREDGRAAFHISANADHLSSLHPQAQALLDSHAAEVETREIEVMTLASLCARHVTSPIDFLKIDVEGAEADVVAGGDWGRWRPALILAEATVPGTSTPNWSQWEPTLLDANYRLVFFDGVNRYYVAEERSELAERFDTPANPFDGAVALHAFGLAFEDSRHPDHGWTRGFIDRVLGAAAIEVDEHLFRLMTWDLLPGELAAAVTTRSLELGFRRVLARSPEPADRQHWIGRDDLDLAMLYRELLVGEEFRAHRSRVSTRSVWR